jgi:uncharacterized iron-regulated membrane protein
VTTLALILVAATALILLLVGGVRLWAARSRRKLDAPVTETDARANALPLTTSVLSVRRRSLDRES